ncbi:MAG: hypothetical protein KGS45_11875 [Planctomycetes bacterium]|nr:hypothetical protein [Planctomycetota bacterium]
MTEPNTPNSTDASAAKGGEAKPSAGDGYEVVGGISNESVLAGFDAERDFDKDIAAAESEKPGTPSPRFERPRKTERSEAAGGASIADVDDVADMPVDGMPLPLIKPAHRSGLDSPQVLFGAGAVIVLVAMIASGWTAKSQNLAVAFLAGYQAILHTITGVVALVVISLLQGRPVGSYEQGAARLLVAIALFQLVMGLELGLFDGKAEEFAIAAAVYAAAMMALFRLRFKVILEIVAVHLLIIGVMWLGTQIAIAAVPTVKR